MTEDDFDTARLIRESRERNLQHPDSDDNPERIRQWLAGAWVLTVHALGATLTGTHATEAYWRQWALEGPR
jgi:hypothetical protein